MIYENVINGQFIARRNRFIAEVEINGLPTVCHVKNTGRCRELLQPGATIYLEKKSDAARKTAYDLIAVEKSGKLFNLDSQAPNKVAAEWLPQSGLFPADTHFFPEQKCGRSRFDFLADHEPAFTWIEVKGVTLEENGVALFPDAPTERGLRHVEELCALQESGVGAMLLFVLQMEGMRSFKPNDQTHPAFGEALRKAAASGVRILAMECRVTLTSMTMIRPVPLSL